MFNCLENYIHLKLTYENNVARIFIMYEEVTFGNN